MKSMIKAYINLLKNDRKKRQRLISLICALSFLVAGGVFWNLRIIGITLSRGALSNPNADVETQTEWEATVPKAEALTGEWGADLVSVALSQLGYKESENNFITDKETGEKKGYTRYGAWSGNMYADWSGLFVSFCLNYANIPTKAFRGSPFAERNPNTLLSALNASPCYMTPKYIPSPGDLIFLDKNGDGAADTMGIITEFDSEKAAEPITASLEPASESPVAPAENINTAAKPGQIAEPIAEEPIPTAEQEAKATKQPTPEAKAMEQPTPEAEIKGVHAIEGDSENEVRETVYAPTDPAILGYLNINAAREAYGGASVNSQAFYPALNKYIDRLGDGVPNPDTNIAETVADDALDEYYRLYLDWSGAVSEPRDILFVIDTSSSMSNSVTTGVTRAQMVKKVLNGEGSEPGIIEKFINGNPNNQVAVVTFDGAAQQDWHYEWEKATTLEPGEVYRFVQANDDAYAGTEEIQNGGTMIKNSDWDTRGQWLAGERDSDGGIILRNVAYDIIYHYNDHELRYKLEKDKDRFKLRVNANNWNFGINKNGEVGMKPYAVSFTLYKRVKVESDSADDARILRDWSRDTSNIALTIKENRETNYSAALLKAAEVLRTSANTNKLMVFISDGEPVYWQYQPDNETVRGGTGNPDNIMCKNKARSNSIEWAARLKTEFPNVQMRSVMIAGENPNMEAINAINQPQEAALVVSDGEELKNSLSRLFLPCDVTITDTLSQYVGWVNDASLKITKIHEGGTPQTIWQGANSSGSAQSGSTDIKSVVYEQSSRKLTVRFADSFAADPLDTYTISFDVKVTAAAGTDIPFTDTGDAGTDYPGNTSSSNKQGFYANASAGVTTSLKTEPENFPKPVVQHAAQSEPEPPATEEPAFVHDKQIDWLGDGVLNDDASVTGSAKELEDFYRLYLNWSGKLNAAYDLVIVVDTSSSMLADMNGRQPGSAGYDSSDTRAHAVEKVLNGETGRPGLIDTFLSGNPENNIAIVTFDGERYDPQWEVVNSLEAGNVYRFRCKGPAGRPLDWYWAALTGGNPVNYDAVRPGRYPSDPDDMRTRWWAAEAADGGVVLANMGYGVYCEQNAHRSFKLDSDGYLYYTENGIQYYAAKDGGFVPNKNDAEWFLVEKCTAQYDMGNDARILKNWFNGTSSHQPVQLNVVSNRATNYTAGLIKAMQVFEAKTDTPNNKKMLIFISDGVPTYYNIDADITNLSTARRAGMGSEEALNVEQAAFYTKQIADTVHEKYPDILMRSLLVNNNPNLDHTCLDQINSELKLNADGSPIHDPQYPDGEHWLHIPAPIATDYDGLHSALNQLLFPYRVTIEDKLSDYVDWVSNSSVKVTRKEINTSETKLIYTGVTAAGGHSENGSNEIKTVSWNGSTVKVEFADDFIADPKYVYTVSFDVKVNNYAKQRYGTDSGYGGTIGDPGTDYQVTGNQTSSGKEGFYSNDREGAVVTTYANGVPTSEHFPMPVVQVHSEAAAPTPEPVYVQKKQIDHLNDGTDNPDTVVDNEGGAATGDNRDFYRLYLEWSGAQNKAYDLLLVIDTSASMRFGMDGNAASADNPSREDTVEEILNGETGLIAEFLGMNPGNRVSAVTFDGLPARLLTGGTWEKMSEEGCSGNNASLCHFVSNGKAITCDANGNITPQPNNPDDPAQQWEPLMNPNYPDYLQMRNVKYPQYVLNKNRDDLTLVGDSGTSVLFAREGDKLAAWEMNEGKKLYIQLGTDNLYHFITNPNEATDFTFYRRLNSDYTYKADTRKITNGWYSSDDPVNFDLDVQTDRGTNYSAGFMKADEVLNERQGSNGVIVLFISDGLPTYYLREVDGKETRFGTGTTSDEPIDAVINTDDPTLYSVKWFRDRHPTINLRSLMINNDKTLDLRALEALDDAGKPFTATNREELEAALRNMLFPYNIVIEDTLSKWVDVPEADQIEFSIIKRHIPADGTDAEPDKVIWKGWNNPETYTGEPGNNEIQSVTFNEDKKLRVEFNQDFNPPLDYKYIVSFNIKVNELAKNTFESNGDQYLGDMGDPDTDHPETDNNTSSDKPGFFANDLAEVIIGNQHNPLPMPVVQVEPKKNPFRVVKNWADDNNAESTRPAGITVYLYQNYTANGTNHRITPAYETVIIHAPDPDNGTWTYDWDDLPKKVFAGGQAYEAFYTVEEAKVPGYTGHVECGQYFPAAVDTIPGCIITNTLAMYGFTVEKREGDLGKALAGAKFRLYKTNESWAELPFDPDTEHPNFDFVPGAGAFPMPVGAEMTTDESGHLTFANLPVGNYLLYETETPAGYLSYTGNNWAGPWRVTITDGDVTVTDKDNNPLAMNGGSAVIPNAPAQEMPATGGSGRLIYTLCGIMLMALPLMYLVYDPRRRMKGGIKKSASSR